MGTWGTEARQREQLQQRLGGRSLPLMLGDLTEVAEGCLGQGSVGRARERGCMWAGLSAA